MVTNMKSLLIDSVKHRYQWTDEPSLGFWDNTIPKSFIDESSMTEKRFISPNLQQMFGGSTIPFKQFVDLQKIDLNDIKEELEKVRDRNLNLLTIGYGGVAINVLHFIAQFAVITGVHYPFSRLVVWEEDNLSLLNVLRLYKPIAAVPCARGEQNKMTLLDSGPELFLAERIHKNYEFLTDDMPYIKNDGSATTVLEEISTKEGVVMFGAPDFTARKLLQTNSTPPFLFVGHGDDTVDIYRKPEVDSTLTVESYGTINLSSFFVNMLHASVALIDILADGREKGPIDELLFTHNAMEVNDE